MCVCVCVYIFKKYIRWQRFYQCYSPRASFPVGGVVNHDNRYPLQHFRCLVVVRIFDCFVLMSNVFSEQMCCKSLVNQIPTVTVSTANLEFIFKKENIVDFQARPAWGSVGPGQKNFSYLSFSLLINSLTGMRKKSNKQTKKSSEYHRITDDLFCSLLVRKALAWH